MFTNCKCAIRLSVDNTVNYPKSICTKWKNKLRTFTGPNLFMKAHENNSFMYLLIPFTKNEVHFPLIAIVNFQIEYATQAEMEVFTTQILAKSKGDITGY